MADVTGLILSDAERMSNILSLFGPEIDQLSFLGLTLKVFHAGEISQDDINNLFSQLQHAFQTTCRGRIEDDYLLESFKKSNIIIVIYFRGEVQAFLMLKTDTDLEAGIIKLVCSKKEPISLGSFLLCITHSYLYNAGFHSVYLDAADESVARYYESLGYLYGKMPCELQDNITDQQLLHKMTKGDQSSFFDFLPEEYPTKDGYPMKLCGSYGQICINAYLKIRETLMRKGLLLPMGH